MPVIAAVAGFAAVELLADTAIMAGIAGVVGTIGADIVVGATVGAVVGGISAAVTGGSIGEGILWGAVGGAVGGGLAGLYDAGTFSSIGLGGGSSTSTEALNATIANANSGLASTSELTPTTFGSGALSGYTAPVQTLDFAKVAGGAAEVGKDAAATTAGLTAKDMMQYSMVSGLANSAGAVLKQEPYNTTQDYSDKQIALAKDLEASKESNALAQINLSNDQKQREAELNAILTREKIAADRATALAGIDQRKLELTTPYDEAALARQRITNSIIGLNPPTASNTATA